MDESEHAKSSLKKFGRNFSGVHAFLDQYYREFGVFHRIFLHHQKGIELVVEKFGEEVRGALELHIMEDVGSIPEDWFFYGEPIFLDLELYEKMENELKILYPDEDGIFRSGNGSAQDKGIK